MSGRVLAVLDANVFVSGLLRLDEFRGVPIVTPRRFLESLADLP